MRPHTLLAAFSLAVASVACGAQERPALDISSDPAFTPPGQGDLEVADSHVEPKAKPKPRARHLLEPNRRAVDERPLHARMTSSR